MKRLPLTVENYRAAIAGRKTMTRRPHVEGRPMRYAVGEPVALTLPHWRLKARNMVWDEVTTVCRCPSTRWPADCPTPVNEDWRRMAARYMPAWACLHHVTITEARVERLQDISDYEAWKEGVRGQGITHYEGEARDMFMGLWDSIYPEGERWADNPMVEVYGFEVQDED